MPKGNVELQGLTLDELGRVVLSEEMLDGLENHPTIVSAGGSTVNGPCQGSTNGSCSNGSCDRSTNMSDCSNVNCNGASNNRFCYESPIY